MTYTDIAAIVLFVAILLLYECITRAYRRIWKGRHKHDVITNMFRQK